MTEIVPGTGEADLLAAEPDLGQADTEREQLGTDYIISPYVKNKGRKGDTEGEQLGTDYIISPYVKNKGRKADTEREHLGTDYIVSPYGKRNKGRKYGK